MQISRPFIVFEQNDDFFIVGAAVARSASVVSRVVSPCIPTLHLRAHRSIRKHNYVRRQRSFFVRVVSQFASHKVASLSPLCLRLMMEPVVPAR